MSFPDVLLSQFGSLDLEGYPSAAPAYAPRRRGGRGGSLDATAKVSALPSLLKYGSIAAAYQSVCFPPSCEQPFTPCSHSSSTHTSSTSTAVPSASAVLPTELLYHLSTFIESPKTLRTLCLVNSTFLEIALPLLYESLVVISGAVLKGVLSMVQLSFFNFPLGIVWLTQPVRSSPLNSRTFVFRPFRISILAYLLTRSPASPCTSQ
jgi:hypothetical protein